jgi:formylglycine-generating enzyme
VKRPIYMGAREVTVAQFRAFVVATKYTTEAEATGQGGYAFDGGGSWVRESTATWQTPGAAWQPTDEHPVVQVTRADAAKFCEWRSREEKCVYRLPTEAEWEYACRAGTATRYSFGDAPVDLGLFGWANGSGLSHPAPVGRKAANPWGLFDVHGNVQEWCARGFQGGHFSVSPTTDPADLGHHEPAVARGGGWANHPFLCRSAVRLVTRPDRADDHTGFRVVRELPGGKP